MKPYILALAFVMVLGLGATASGISPVCGDGVCEGDEDVYNCPEDCNICGDGVCYDGDNESMHNCYDDCGKCGDGVCIEGPETYASCKADCKKKHKYKYSSGLMFWGQVSYFKQLYWPFVIKELDLQIGLVPQNVRLEIRAKYLGYDNYKIYKNAVKYGTEDRKLGSYIEARKAVLGTAF